MSTMTLEETNVNHELGNVDLSKITALQQKRTIAFINHFVLTNIQFLNNFMKKCEQSLMNFERKLEKINAAMVLLESRLSSIPELGTTPVTSTPSVDPQNEAASIATQAVTPKPPEGLTVKSSEVVTSKSTEGTPSKETSNSETSGPAESVESVGQNKPTSSPEYERFLKMVHVGVPLPAVKLKVTQQGLDPNVLDELLGK